MNSYTQCNSVATVAEVVVVLVIVILVVAADEVLAVRKSN